MANSLDMNMDVKGVEQVKALLSGVGLDIKDLREPMSEVGSRAISVFSGQVFASQGGFIGQPWPRLSPR